MASACGGVALHWGCVRLGWYLQGSALVEGSLVPSDGGGVGGQRASSDQRGGGVPATSPGTRRRRTEVHLAGGLTTLAYDGEDDDDMDEDV